MQAVIMAGGKGTRLRSITGDEIPKPMAPVSGKPILQWQVETLRDQGVDRILLVVGYQGQVIVDYFGDGADFGVSITYYQEKEPLGTAGALPALLPELEPFFLLVFGDVIFDIDLSRMTAFHKEHQALATLFVHPNSHPFDSDLILTDSSHRVCGIHRKTMPRDFWYPNCVNAGFYLFEKDVFARIPAGKKYDLEKDVLLPLIKEGQAVYAYRSPEYIKDVGTPDRIQKAQEELDRGIVKARCLKNRQKCVFLDRDGTINQYRGLISREEDLALEPCAARAIRLLNEAGYLVIVVTNQPVVARGLCGIEDVERIHNKMETLLGLEGAYLDAIRFCPHHPDKGYPEENPRYKIPCTCRKPQTGMIDDCLEKYNIDPEKSWMVGDTTMDIRTGLNAGLHTALVRTGEAGKDGKYPVRPQMVGDDLLSVAQNIVQGRV